MPNLNNPNNNADLLFADFLSTLLFPHVKKEELEGAPQSPEASANPCSSCASCQTPCGEDEDHDTEYMFIYADGDDLVCTKLYYTYDEFEKFAEELGLVDYEEISFTARSRSSVQ